MTKKIVFIENIKQAEEFIKRKNDFKDFSVISFTFPVEKFLSENNIEFKTEDDYEENLMYKGIYYPSIKDVKTICNNIDFYYKNINLFPLFIWKMEFLVSLLRGYKRILSKIIEKENPSEITVFENRDFQLFNEEYVSKIIKEIFTGKINIKNYKFKMKNKSLHLKIAGFFQNIFSRYKIQNIKEKNNNIFLIGPKYLFGSTISILVNDKRNKFFRINDYLQKSFFINNQFIPFFMFSGIKNKDENFLEEQILKFKNNIDNIDFNKRFNIEKQIEPIIKEWIKEIANSEFIKISRYINQALYLINNKKIDIVLLHNTSNIFEKTIAKVCELNNIPTIVFQHGLYGIEIGTLPIDSRYIIVFGKESKKWFIKKGIKKESIVELGCPRFDELILNKEKNKEKIILYPVEAGNSDIIIPGRDLTKKVQKQTLKMIINVMKKFPEYKLIIKTRNAWDMNSLPEKILEKENYTNVEIIENTDNLKLLNNAEFVIVPVTTMGMEALLLEKKVINIETKNLDRFNLYKNKGIPIVYNEKELEKVITKLKKENISLIKNIKNFNKKNFYKLDGKASERAASFITKILNNQKEKKYGTFS